jgi:hypothetical protein
MEKYSKESKVCFQVILLNTYQISFDNAGRPQAFICN